MRKTKFKPMFLSYDWKESPGQVIEDLEPLLKKFGIHIIPDPICLGSDTYGYIITDNLKMAIGEYRKYLGSEYGDADEWLDDVCKEFNLTDNHLLTELIKEME